MCLALFPWASFRATKAAVKLHILLDLRGTIPAFIHISDGTLHDGNVLDLLIPEPGACICDGPRLPRLRAAVRLHQAGSFFVTSAKSNFTCTCLYSRPVARSTGLICDQDVELTVFYSQQRYLARWRRVRDRDAEGRSLVFLTHHMPLPASTVCELYRLRWQVELFFKWIKPHLRITCFFGTSAHAVKTQEWIAVSVSVSWPSFESDWISRCLYTQRYRS